MCARLDGREYLAELYEAEAQLVALQETKPELQPRRPVESDAGKGRPHDPTPPTGNVPLDVLAAEARALWDD